MFGKDCALIGVIHLPPLPGAAGYGGSMSSIVSKAIAEGVIYKETGFDALIVENTHDAPYLKGHVQPETTASMTVVATALKKELPMPIGVQLLAGANAEALGVALAADLDFIRVEGFVFAHVGDEGIHEACAGELIRRRFYLQAENIKIFVDIKKKHASHSITEDISLSETAINAEYFKADGVVVTGIKTGHAPTPSDVRSVKTDVGIPVLVGSGVTAANLKEYARSADALIVGSDCKVEGHWMNEVCPQRCNALVEAARL